MDLCRRVRADGGAYSRGFFSLPQGDGDDREHGFRVFHPRMKRQMYFLCDTKELAQRWLEAVQAAIELRMPPSRGGVELEDSGGAADPESAA